MSKIQTILREAIGENKWHKEFECNGAYNGKGCFETFCEDQNCRNAPKEYNQALEDLRAKIPEIEKAIVEEIQLQLMKGWDKIEIEQGDTTMAEWRNFKFIRNTTREIIKNLTS